jgi:dTDP-4-amino-4,6-dideoxygalactose transaminase
MAKQIEESSYRQSRMSVPFLDLKSQHRILREDLWKVWDEVLDSAGFIGGSPVEQFEKAFAAFCETKNAVGVGNGTDALLLALRALGIGRGDEVIVPANSFVATAAGVVHAGATPVFVDIDPRTYNIDVNQIENHISPQTKAIIPVHLYGQPADMNPVLELARLYGLRVIEDAAQAHGALYHGRRAGSMGDAACFSFYPGKNLGACGDGGAVVTNDPDLAQSLRRLREHGGLRKYEHDVVGYNSRLDSLQAAALHIKLGFLDERNEMRGRHAESYRELLSDITGIVTPFVLSGVASVHHLYVIRVETGSRAHLQDYLKDHGVQTLIHYPTPIHRTRAFAEFRTQDCPIAEEYAERILSLPMYPELEKSQLEYVAGLLSDFMQA